MRHVALLRGINVGGKNKLPMKDLVALCQAIGATDVTTYIASGNVLFSATPTVEKTFAAKLEAAIKKQLGLSVPVVTRSQKALAAALGANPWLKAGVDPDHLHVMFLGQRPTAAQVKTLDPNRSPGDRYEVVGQEIYLALPNGVGNSKLTNAYFDKALATVSTARNWRTAEKLLALLG